MALASGSAGNLRLCVFDTAIATDNLGDHIIMDAVWDVIHSIFGPGAPTTRIATHLMMPRETYRRLSQFDIGIVGGTNILKSHMFIRANWRLRLHDMFFLKNVVLLGVGWQQYQGPVDILSRALFKRVLSNKFMHSVRDEYTLDHMRGQVKRVEYTACPTLWSLTGQRCAAVPTSKARSAIFSLTHYRPDPADAALIRLLLQEYETVHFWCQMEKDRDYLNSLSLGLRIPVIVDVDSYNRVLAAGSVDVIGTRLHGGIRALQCGCRALILTVDNRAIELAKKTNIPVVDRRDLGSIKNWIGSSPAVSISLPWDAINAWKSQFRDVG
jgi:polysaccharide pyruvyl transferase WcaK-like protein